MQQRAFETVSPGTTCWTCGRHAALDDALAQRELGVVTRSTGDW
jgi:hypothetical protein